MSIRTLREIAKEIETVWPKVNFAAKEYLDAMLILKTVDDQYYFDTGRDVVARFLCNATSFRGEDARRIKAELKGML